MTLRKHTRDPRIQENSGSSVKYQMAIPTYTPKGQKRYQDADAGNLSDTFDGLSNILATYQKKSVETDKKAGLALGVQGGQLVPGEKYSDEFRESYWQSKGSRDVADFKAQATRFVAENPNMDPKAVSAHLDGVFTGMLKDKNNAYATGFALQAYDIKQRLTSAQAVSHATRIRKEDLDNKGIEFRNILNPDMDVKDLRMAWSMFQKNAVAAGYTRDEINTEFLSHLTDYVIEQIESGRDEAITMFDVKGIADGDGVILRDVGDMGTMFRSAYNTAMNAKNIREAKEDRDESKRREQIHKDAFTLTHDVLQGTAGIEQVQSYLDKHRDDMAPRTLESLEKFITDDFHGDHQFINEHTDRDVFARATNSTLEDDYTEDQLNWLYSGGQIRRETYVAAMRRYTTANSADYRAAVNSGAYRVVTANMDHLRHFRFMELNSDDVVPESFGGSKANPKITYLDFAVNELNQRIIERLTENGQVSQEEIRAMGKEVRDEIQTRAEKSEQNPLKVLVRHLRDRGGKLDDSVFDLYRYLRGDLTLSNQQVKEELVRISEALTARPQVNPVPPTTGQKRSVETAVETSDTGKSPADGNYSTKGQRGFDPETITAIQAFFKQLTAPDTGKDRGVDGYRPFGE